MHMNMDFSEKTVILSYDEHEALLKVKEESEKLVYAKHKEMSDLLERLKTEDKLYYLGIDNNLWYSHRLNSITTEDEALKLIINNYNNKLEKIKIDYKESLDTYKDYYELVVKIREILFDDDIFFKFRQIKKILKKELC